MTVERKKPETLRLRKATPMFTVNDLDESLSWYRDVLGCVVHDGHTRDGKRVAATLMAGNVAFLLGQDDFAKGRGRVKGIGVRLYCETVQDVDQIAASIKARGGTLATEPTDQPWGSRDFAVKDPDGYLISISTAMEGS